MFPYVGMCLRCDLLPLLSVSEIVVNAETFIGFENLFFSLPELKFDDLPLGQALVLSKILISVYF